MRGRYFAPARRDLGPVTIVGLVAAWTILWLVERPAGDASSYWGQWFGALSILLLSIGLVLASTFPGVESWFDGIDLAAVWHRRVAITALIVLVPHLALASNPDSSALAHALAVIGAVGLLLMALWAILPRLGSLAPASLRDLAFRIHDASWTRGIRGALGGYSRWRAWHRATGLFVMAGFVHGVLGETAFAGAPLLRWTYLTVGGIGIVCYAYRELLARYTGTHLHYEVDSVRTIDDGLVEIALRPLGTGIAFVPGQFAMVYLEAKDGWHRHPFTIASAPSERVVRFTVKALGDYTSELHELVEPGMPAVLGAPHGRFDHGHGTYRQVWIAGGVGVTPFLSWLRALDGHLDQRVDFFYSTDGEAPYTDEIRDIAGRHGTLTVHVIDSTVTGFLTTKTVLATVGDTASAALTVFMCGPEQMLRTFQAGFHAAGVPRSQVHREHFDWR
jgi:predicted ferric reductase